MVEFKSKKTGDIEMVGAGETVTATKDGLGAKSTFDVGVDNKIWEDAENETYDKDYFSKNIRADLEEGEKSGKSTNAYVAILFFIGIGFGYFVFKRKKKVKNDDSDKVKDEADL